MNGNMVNRILNGHVADKNSWLNQSIDATVCSLRFKGYQPKTIIEALRYKAEAMVQEFNLKEE